MHLNLGKNSAQPLGHEFEPQQFRSNPGRNLERFLLRGGSALILFRPLPFNYNRANRYEPGFLNIGLKRPCGIVSIHEVI